MKLDVAGTQRWSRQIALPELGGEGQRRLAAATAVIVGGDRVAETAAEYLAAAGVGELRRAPAGGAAEAWLAALAGASIAVRSGFDDDPMLPAAVRLGVPVVVARAQPDAVDVVAFRKHGPCPHGSLDVAPRAAPASDEGAAAVVAATLAATEALWILAGPGEPPRARHLRLPLDGGEPHTQEIPWTPECFLCGGTGREASFT